MARPDAEILKAVLFGDRSGLSYSLGDTIASLGLSHLIAISGLNIGLIVLFGYILAYTCIRIIPPLAVRLDTPLV
jgi:competence protein ComEC